MAYNRQPVTSGDDDIDTFVLRYGKPNALTLSPDTHIFHFNSDGDWETEQVVLVNRNGHYFRIVQIDGEWHMYKTWNALLAFDDWMDSKLKRPDPRKLIELCGIGSQSKTQSFETLSLLPKGTTAGRKAVYRGLILDVRFDMKLATFALTHRGPTESPSKTFHGKLWESGEAATWCKSTFSAANYNIEDAPQDSGAAISMVAVPNFASMDDNPLWGAF